jgi:5-hydroxyisourate hydrolase-like protein (transthyretin family)
VLVFFLFAALCTVSAGEFDATVKGFVMDQATGMPFSGVVVDIYKSDDHSTTAASVKTDERGYYETEVAGGQYYDIYVRLGDPNPYQRTQSVVQKNGVYTINFNVHTETNYSERVVERYGFWIVVVVAAIILLVILFDQLFFRRRRVVKALEDEQVKLKKRLEETTEEPKDELARLEKERDKMYYMINLSKIKFHKRELDEESFREIVRDYEKKLIEIEARIEELKSK